MRSSCAGRNMMRGICGRRRSEIFTVDGFYPTGDLGRLDDDGYLFLTGRCDDMFKVRGATVYPSEVEAALRTIDGVGAVYVVDVERDGALAVAAVVVGNGGSAVTVDDLAARGEGPPQRVQGATALARRRATTTCRGRRPARSTRPDCKRLFE